MIKKLTDKEINKGYTTCSYLIVLGSVFFILAILSVIEDANGKLIISFEGYELLILGYGLVPLIIGILWFIELTQQYYHPENFVYCKKCKKIIRKKHIFCSECRMDIRSAIRHKEDKKYIKNYKKFYKDKKK